MIRLGVGVWLVSGALVLLCAGLQYPAYQTPVDPTECALILNTPSEHLLNSIFPYQPTQTCITYEAVNQAYVEARKRNPVSMPHGDEWESAQVATVGELLLDISAQLAKTYGMNIEDIEKGLPLIDTSKTLIKEVCPGFLSDVACEPGKYRRHDGLCNNIDNPSWGAINTPFTRLMSPQFADGMTHPREGVLGTQLPLPRIVSRTIHPDEGYHDHAGTVMVVAWGQFMDHDFTLTATPLDRRTKNEPEECCNRPPHLKHPYCMEIVIPEDDYFYSKLGVTCQDFVRSFPAVRPGCKLGSRTPFNTLTGVIDGNTVYGVQETFSRHLRSGYGGLLRMNPVFNEYGLKDLLPLKVDIPEEGCTRANGTEFCFEAGEIRVNEQLVLACMHTLMAREHNRIAKELAKVNPHWDDETLYQEARRIVIAQIQHITFNEFLPIILGKEVMEKFGLMLEKEGYWDGYDASVNPNIIDAFSAAAFRFGHSLLPTAVERWSKAHKFIASKRLSDLIRRPYDLYRPGVMDEYIMGLMNQVAQAMDDSITQEVTNHLLKKPGAHFGMDLVAFNMQRGREFGVPGYMYFRKFCGLPVTESFEELFGTMPNTTVFRYNQIFDHTMDIDLWSGGVSEKPLPGSMVGPTFACVIATQMSYVRRGDRFWYELPNQPSSFTPEQLQEVRKTKLSRIICDNTDLIDTIQVYPMVLPDHEINPRVPCRSGILPSIDFSKWAEYPQHNLHNESQTMQNAQKQQTRDGPTKDGKSGEEDILIVTNNDNLTLETNVKCNKNHEDKDCIDVYQALRYKHSIDKETSTKEEAMEREMDGNTSNRSKRETDSSKEEVWDSKKSTAKKPLVQQKAESNVRYKSISANDNIRSTKDYSTNPKIEDTLQAEADSSPIKYASFYNTESFSIFSDDKDAYYKNRYHDKTNDEVYSIHGYSAGKKVPAYKWADYQRHSPKHQSNHHSSHEYTGRRKPFYSPSLGLSRYRTYSKPKSFYKDSLSSYGSVNFDRVRKEGVSTSRVPTVDSVFFRPEIIRHLDQMLKDKGPEMDKLLKGDVITGQKPLKSHSHSAWHPRHKLT